MTLRGKKGQGVFGLSYGAIFSIFIIIFILAVAFFAIRHFMSLSDCTQVGLTYDELQKEVEKVWLSDRTNALFEGTVSASGVEMVCFGTLDATVPANQQAVHEEFVRKYGLGGDENVFIYPPTNACDGTLAGYHLDCRNGKSECMTTEGNFFCANVTNGKFKINLYKENTSPLVSIREYSS